MTASRAQLEQVRVITNEDTRTNERTAEFYDAFYGPANIAALISAPLIRDGVPIGAFTVASRTPRQWTVHEAALVASVGERAWLLIERQRSIQALRESEARYRRIVEHAHEGIWEADPDGITLYVNAGMAEMLGTTPEAMIGTSANAYVMNAELDTVATLLESRRLGLVETYEFPLRRADGALIWTLISSVHFAAGEETPVNAFWSFTMYNTDNYLVANPIGRYAIGSRDELTRNPDGSLDLIQADQPEGELASNWLPAPKAKFQLLLRTGRRRRPWEPPPIKKIGREG
ncbi:MAG: hypothetical protein JWP01_3071 [Myxococcales bacterium]|nr:hypothetical protein [Myxococcales bacterium]